MKQRAAPTLSQACTLAIAPNMHALCMLIITCTHEDETPIAATHERYCHVTLPFTLNAAPPAQRWSGLIGRRLKAESTSACQKLGDACATEGKWNKTNLEEARDTTHGHHE